MDWESRKREALRSDEYQIILKKIQERRSRKMRRTRRPRNPRTQWHCNVCGIQFRSIEGVLETGRVVTCVKCGGKVCRARCSSQDHLSRWICQTCQNPDSWFKGILKVLNPNSIRVHAYKTKMNPNRIDEIDEDLEVLKKKEKEEVRDFIERLVEAMLGGNIDSTSVTRIYSDEKYDSIITRYHTDLSSILTDLGSALHMSIANLPIIGQSPCSAHASLKLLIQRIIQEAIGLPVLKRTQEHPATPIEDKNRTYEDLLATAILNKVIQNYQEELPTSSGNSVSSRVSSSSRQNDKEYFFGAETLETKWKSGSGTVPDTDTTSVSSLEEWVRSDSSVGSTKYLDHMSLTIQQRIEEVSSSDDEAEPEDRTPRRITPTRNGLAPESDEWQENWSMQKRKFGGTASPVPVPMLVPNPTTEAKVLIGDRDAEDTTDLSDVGSDFGDTEPVQGIETILVESKTLIGGKNILADISVDDQNVSEDGSTDVSDMAEEKEHILEQLVATAQEADREVFKAVSDEIENKPPSDAESHSLTSLESQTEQDTEYTEKYATLPRTILKSPASGTRDLQNITSFNHQEKHIEEPQAQEVAPQIEEIPKQNGHHEPEALAYDETELEEKFKGSYSEREKQKWQHAIEMKNNPYSTENLNRRLSQSSNGSNSTSVMEGKSLRDVLEEDRKKDTSIIRYGRDYYIREATRSAGAKKKLLSTEDSGNFGAEEEQSSVFKAVPAVVDTNDSPLQTDTESSIEVSSPLQQKSMESFSDSDMSVERIYNLPSGKVYEKIGNTNREIVNGTKSPEGIKYLPIDTEVNGFNDENRNLVANDRKREFLRSLTTSEDDENPASQVSSPVNEVFFSEESLTNSHVPSLADSVDAPEQVLNDPDKTISEDKEFSLEYSTDGFENATASPENSSLNDSADPEIVDLKDKRLVKDLLGKFSKSYPNIASVPLRKAGIKKEGSVEDTSTVKMLDTSVDDLRRRFSKDEDSDSKQSELSKQVHSLTARSIPREFREELKGKENGVVQEIEENLSTTEIQTPEEEVPVFPTAKSRIQFFESLKR